VDGLQALTNMFKAPLPEVLLFGIGASFDGPSEFTLSMGLDTGRLRCRST